jgi:galactosyl transferase GMA12/MNN10 family
MSDIKICFLQVTSPEIYDYSKYSTEINKMYCNQHGYSYLELPTVKTNEYAPQWSKIFQVKDVLKTGEFTHIFFLDADAIIINRNKKLEDVIDKMKTFIAFSENGLNGGELINTGAFICTIDAVEILEECIRISEKDMQEKKFGYWHEQSIINDMYKNGIKMDVFPMNEINSHWIYYEENENQFVYHFMARSISDKIKIAKYLFEKYK